MILANNIKLEKNLYINNILEQCTEFIRNHDVKNLPCGKYSIDGENFYVNIVSYYTKEEKQCIWEAHREYLDIHYIIDGKEQIRLSNIQNMEIEAYVEESDYVKIKGTPSIYVNLKEGEYLTLFFEDAHMTACCIEAVSYTHSDAADECVKV